MKLSIGIVGLPNAGKSTLFKLLTQQEVHIAHYPFTTINPNVGIVPVPDKRLDTLSEITGIKQKVPAVIEFYDIAGLVRNAHKGEGLGNQFLAHIRECQAIVIVLRAFQNAGVTHVENSIDPLRDFEIINAELILKDLETVRKMLAKAESEARSGAKDEVRFRDELTEIKDSLERGLTKNIPSYSHKNIKIGELQLLTAKKQLYLINGKAEDIPNECTSKIANLGAEFVIADLGNVEEAPRELITAAYRILGLITFYTIAGKKEVRAWPIRKGISIRDAAGEIHTDFKEKFIRAEVIQCDKLFEAARSVRSSSDPWQLAKSKGWIRLEGRDYAVSDGDVILVKHG